MSDVNGLGSGRATGAGGRGGESGLAEVVHRNIDALSRSRARDERRKGVYDAVADAIARLAGSFTFVLLHVLFFGGWFLVNIGRVRHVGPFDPLPFPLLSTITCVEAIFLSSFILISQNRARRLADKRAELNVQVSLLTEHEVTHAIHLLDAIAKLLGVEHPNKQTLADIKKDVSPDQIVQEIERAEELRTD